MDGPARAGRDRTVITRTAGPGAGKGAAPPRSSRGSGQPVSPTGAEAVYRKLFDSFDRDRDDKVSQWAVLSRLQGCGLLPDDPRIQEALAGLTATEGASKQISFGQFKALAKHNSSLIQRAVEGNLAVPDFPALSSDIERMYGELLPVRSGSVADYIPQLRRVDPDQLAIAVCTVDGQRFSAGDAADGVLPAVGVQDGQLLPGSG